MIAAEAEVGLFARHPHGGGSYAGRLICRALCQGVAQHYLDGRSGVKDFDVWSSYGPFPYGGGARRITACRSSGATPETCRRSPAAGSTCSADRSTGRSAPTRPMRCEASRRGAHRHGPGTGRKAVVLICPDHLVGEIVWPTAGILRLHPLPEPGTAPR